MMTTGQTGGGADLVERLRAGDENAYERLVAEYGGRLMRTARRLLPTEDDAEDAVQECLIAAFRAMHGFAGEARLSTWLHRILVNVCLMRMRSQRRRPEEFLEDALPEFDDAGSWFAPPGDWYMPVDGRVQAAELRAIVRDCCMRLPENYRTVLMLRLVEGLETDEVAVQLAISTNAVKVRLHRARQALGELLRAAIGARPTDTGDHCEQAAVALFDCA